MSQPLPQPVQVKVGIAVATCTDAQFGATIQRYNNPPLVSYVVLGVEDPAAGEFIPVEGVRVDNGKPSTSTQQWTREEYDRCAALPEVQAALAKLYAMHAWIEAGREGAAPF